MKASRPKRARRQSIAELRALQRLMARAVMRPLTASLRMRPRWMDGRPTKTIAAGFIKPNSRLTSFERLEIYNRQYWLRVSDCFYEDYSGLRAVLGEDRFHDLAIAYLVNHPSTRFTLRDLGGQLADFIQAEPRWTAPHQELALDMARLEWAHIEAFDNEARPPVTPADFSGRDAARIRLRLQPHITLLKLAYPVDEFLISSHAQTGLRGEASNAIADARKTGDEVKINDRSTPPNEPAVLPLIPSFSPTGGEGARLVRRSVPRQGGRADEGEAFRGNMRVRRSGLSLPERRAIRLAVHRHQNVVYYKRLQPRQYDLLRAFERGASLEKALQTLPATATPPPVQDWFQNWAALGWFWMRD